MGMSVFTSEYIAFKVHCKVYENYLYPVQLVTHLLCENFGPRRGTREMPPSFITLQATLQASVLGLQVILTAP
jgi:hypothetical protein